MRKVLLAATAAAGLLLVAAGPARAFTGNQLLAMCTSSSKGDRGLCFGYIAGVRDTVYVLGDFIPQGTTSALHCAGPEVEITQMIDVVKMYLQAHPEGRHKHALPYVLFAMRDAFPCN